MSLTKAEQEVVISKCADEDSWTVYSTDPVWTRFFTKLAEEVGARVFQHQGGTKFLIPGKVLRFAQRRKRNLTPEQRAELAARGRAHAGNLRQAQAATAMEDE